MDLLLSLELGSPGETPRVSALTGGVASDIALVELEGRAVVLKFPLEKLNVGEDWYAPLGRNEAEYHWLKFAGEVAPGCAPQVLGRDNKLNGFAMEYVHGDDVYLWKSALLERRPGDGEAARVGNSLGQIHAASSQPGFPRDRFQNQDDFDALRIEPYLRFTAESYPDLRWSFKELAEETRRHSPVLIHGDVSPKNILIRSGQPVFLDAECATMGDPGFDVAFCMNHLVLKSFHMPDRCDELLGEARQLWHGYAQHVDWEAVPALETRICRLLPALMLARLDGRSPVEYLVANTKHEVRACGTRILAQPPTHIDDILGAIGVSIKR